MAWRFSENGLALLKQFEGCVLTAYRDEGGKLTIGYGDTANVREGLKISQTEAEERLRARLEREFVPAVVKALKVPVSQNAFDALVSLAYNIGVGAIASSTLIRHLNAGKRTEAALEFGKWVNVNKVISPNLVRRRFRELVHFLT